MGNITLGIPPACHLKIFLSFLLNCFPLPALVALLLTRWLLAYTDRESGPFHSHRQTWLGVTQSRDEVKTWVSSKAGVLLCSGGGFDEAAYQKMLAALRPLTAPLSFLEHSSDPARRRQGDCEKDVSAVWGSGHWQGWRYPTSQRTLPRRKPQCGHPGRHVR